MTDETRPEGQPTADNPETGESATAVATPEGQEPEKKKLPQTVEIADAGPCRKHLKITIERGAIDERMGEHFSKLLRESNVTGFRPGKAPRRLIEKRFHKEVGEQVKQEVLLASLEQLEEYDIAPISAPDIDPEKIEIPEKGPLVYEFEVEVRPQFDLPPYRGLKLRRPTKTFTEADVAEARRRLLAPHGQIVPKEKGAVELGDVIVADVTFKFGDRVLNRAEEAQIVVEKELAFKDALVKDFGAKMQGAKAGDSRTLALEMSSAAAGEMGGKTVQATFDVKDVKTIRLPELTNDFVSETFGVNSPDALDEAIRVHLNRVLEHQQRRSARMQVLSQIAAASTWELPRDLLIRQANKALARRMMEMKADGMTDQEIAQERRRLEQNILESTALTLKEHFVLQKIAEVEKIDIDEQDLEDEIDRIAVQTNESPRRIRARLEKEDSLDALAAEMIERKALDLILDSAEYEDVPVDKQEEPAPLATVDTQAVPGEMRDPTAEAQQPTQEGNG
jgi:trigger factor